MVLQREKNIYIDINISEAGASDSSSLNPLRIIKSNQTQQQSG